MISTAIGAKGKDLAFLPSFQKKPKANNRI
jgi:hypothetical protein